MPVKPCIAPLVGDPGNQIALVARGRAARPSQRTRRDVCDVKTQRAAGILTGSTRTHFLMRSAVLSKDLGKRDSFSARRGARKVWAFFRGKKVRQRLRLISDPEEFRPTSLRVVAHCGRFVAH